ncbi:MAG: hypothetical protein RIR00_2560 [Pseudomonadota bacterium]|jgi:zinc protease
MKSLSALKFSLFSLLRLCLLLLPLAAQAGIPIQTWQTSQGAKVMFVESRSLPMLDIQVDFAAGSMFDPAGQSGLAALTRAVLDLGAGPWSESDISSKLADVGAKLGGGADTDRASVNLRSLSATDKLHPALELLQAILHQPRFDPDIFARERERTIAGLKDSLTRPDTLAGRAFWQALYPQHPYGRQATPEGLEKLQAADAQRFQQQHYTAANATISLVGDLDRAGAERIAEALAAGLPAGKRLALPAAPSLPGGGTQHVAHPASQSHILIGLPTLERGNPDIFPLLVGNYTLGGGGFVSRLMQEVRDKRGYAYSVYSYFSPLRQAGPFQIGLQTKRSQSKEALQLSLSILRNFLADGPSEADLAAAKANLVGSFPLRLDSNKKLLDNIANIGFYNLPLDWLDRYQERLQAVTAAQVKAAFAKYVKPRNMVTVIVAGE